MRTHANNTENAFKKERVNALTEIFNFYNQFEKEKFPGLIRSEITLNGKPELTGLAIDRLGEALVKFRDSRNALTSADYARFSDGYLACVRTLLGVLFDKPSLIGKEFLG